MRIPKSVEITVERFDLDEAVKRLQADPTLTPNCIISCAARRAFTLHHSDVMSALPKLNTSLGQVTLRADTLRGYKLLTYSHTSSEANDVMRKFDSSYERAKPFDDVEALLPVTFTVKFEGATL